MLIDTDKLKYELFADNYNEKMTIQEVADCIDYQTAAFDIDMVLDQLEDYGKYKGVLKLDDDKCENYIPVSVAKQIVKGRGLGGVLGYLKEKEGE